MKDDKLKKIADSMDAMSPAARLHMMRFMVETLPPEKRDAVNECQRRIKALVAEYGDMGVMALSMAMAEDAAK